MDEAKKRLALATVGRSDFAILQPLARKLLAHRDFDVGWWVGGAHFDPMSGQTAQEVAQSGVPIWGTVNSASYAAQRTELSTVETMALQLAGFGHLAATRPADGVRIFADEVPPDLAIILGDRFEAVVAGLAMVPFRIPVAHISGGSVTEGAIDDVFRNCLTKIATIHFCDLPEFARRIQYMGERSDRIFTTGALGLDAFTDDAVRPFSALAQQFGLSGLEPGFVLATLHPESQRPEVNSNMARAMIEALDRFGRQVVFTFPNADPGSDEIAAELLSAPKPGERFLIRSFGATWYPTVMAHAGCMVGNSSGGIIEAASFSLPVVDIGERQRGRQRGANVVHCGRETREILQALVTVTDPVFERRANAPNIYGDGHGADRVIQVLEATDLKSLATPKRFATPDPSFAGDRMPWP